MLTLFQTIRNYKKEVEHLKSKLATCKRDNLKERYKNQILFYTELIKFHTTLAQPYLEEMNTYERNIITSYYYNLKNWTSICLENNNNSQISIDSFRKSIERSLEQLDAPDSNNINRP